MAKILGDSSMYQPAHDEPVCQLFLVFNSHVIKTTCKNCNHLINKFKSLGCDRICQNSGLCCFSFARYLQKCVTQIYRALYADAMFVPFGGAQTWRLWCSNNICRWRFAILEGKYVWKALNMIIRVLFPFFSQGCEQ